MNHHEPDDWAPFVADWHSTPRDDIARVDEVRRRIHRQTVRLYLMVAGEVLISVTALGIIAGALINARDWPTRVLALALLLSSVSVWAFSIRNRRGIWRPAAETLEGFRMLERRRLQRRLASARFAQRYSLVSLVFLGIWAAWRVQTVQLAPVQRWVIVGVAIYLAGWILGATIAGKRAAAEVCRSERDELDRVTGESGTPIP